MSTDTASIQSSHDAQEAAMLSAVAGLLRCDAFLTEHLETLIAVERDVEAAAEARTFAGLSLGWFAQQATAIGGAN